MPTMFPAKASQWEIGQAFAGTSVPGTNRTLPAASFLS